MRIEIWSDVVCPWCFIGKRRLETALAGFDHADEVEVVWRSFELDPSAPTEPTTSVVEHLGTKYGGGRAAGEQMQARVAEVAAGEGLTFRNGEALWGSTHDAHRLLHLALAEGGPQLQGRLKEALLAAYFEGAESPTDHAVLTRVATGAGLDAGRVAEVLASGEYAEAVQADQQQAAAFGATGVPFVVVDRTYGVSGAQPAEVFGQVLQQAWDDAHPVLQTVGGGASDDTTCGPDGCAV
jgi:predicted DsbA family dithiol-disulfide isomerase